MGNFDSRKSKKMCRRKAQAAKKARLKRRIEAGKAAKQPKGKKSKG
jgi:hypothetical protein